MFVTFAETGSSPTASNAGYVANDASPAMLPVNPPATPAAIRKANSAGDTGGFSQRPVRPTTAGRSNRQALVTR